MNLEIAREFMHKAAEQRQEVWDELDKDEANKLKQVYSVSEPLFTS